MLGPLVSIYYELGLRMLPRVRFVGGGFVGRGFFFQELGGICNHKTSASAKKCVEFFRRIVEGVQVKSRHLMSVFDIEG